MSMILEQREHNASADGPNRKPVELDSGEVEQLVKANEHYTATRLSKELGVPGSFILDRAPCSGESHHVSRFAHTTNFYRLADVRDWLASPEGQKAFAAWKTEQGNRTTKTFANCTVIWIEWSGSLNHSKACQRTACGCTVVDRGGQFVEVRLPDGSTMKKKKTATGFSYEVPTVPSTVLTVSDLVDSVLKPNLF